MKPVLDYITKTVSSLNFYQNTFKWLTWIIIPTTFLLMGNVFEFFKYANKNQITTGEFSDIYIVIGSAILQYFVFIIVRRTCTKFFYYNIEDKYIGDERLIRVDKMVKLTYDSIFYATSSVFAFYCFMNTKTIPKWLFGTGECREIFDGYPVKPDVPYFNEFYLYQMGNHFYRLLIHLVKEKNEPKFYEMHLHHWVAFWLIVYSYFLNFTQSGAIVLILHDLGDIFLSTARIYDSLKNKIKVLWYVLVGSVIASWTYTRLMFLPACVNQNLYDHFSIFTNKFPELWPMIKMPLYFQYSLLWVLVLLHAYWVGTFTIVGILALRKGSVKLSQNAKRSRLLANSENQPEKKDN